MTKYLSLGQSPTCSGDRYVRLKRKQLLQIAFSHLGTSPDPAVLEDAATLHGGPVCRAGWTEWLGKIADSSIVLGFAWDWAQLPGGIVHALATVSPRTNLRVISDSGYDLPDDENAAELLELTKRLDWKPHVISIRSDSSH